MTALFSSVEKGGWLFEYYLHSCSGYAVNELYDSYLNAPDASTKSSMFVDILKKCSSHFSGWLLFHINSVGTLGRKKMFYITFVDHYFGLSRDGIELNSAIGYGVTLGMYNRERKSSSFLISMRHSHSLLLLATSANTSIERKVWERPRIGSAAPFKSSPVSLL